MSELNDDCQWDLDQDRAAALGQQWLEQKRNTALDIDGLLQFATKIESAWQAEVAGKPHRGKLGITNVDYNTYRQLFATIASLLTPADAERIRAVFTPAAPVDRGGAFEASDESLPVLQV